LPAVLTLTYACVYGQGPQGGYHEEYEPSPYHYEYKVNDPKEYLDFGAEEEGDGQGDVQGYYHVQLPDGRLQHVKYSVNGYSGYVADVSYDGHAEHPSYHGHGGGGSVHGVGHSLGHRIGKTLQEVDQSLVNVESKVAHEIDAEKRAGKAINAPQSAGISNFAKTSFQPATGFRSNFGSASNVSPFQSFGSSGSSNFGNPTRFNQSPSNTLGSTGSVFQSRSDETVRKPLITSTKPLSSSQQPSNQFTTFGSEPLKEHSGFSNNIEPIRSSTFNDNKFSRHGKSGRQDGFSSNSINGFDQAIKTEESRSNGFFEKESSSKPKTFDSFNPIVGQSSSTGRFSDKPTKSFDSFSPIFGNKERSKEIVKTSEVSGKFSKKFGDSFDSFSPIFGQPSRKPELLKSSDNSQSGTFPAEKEFFQSTGKVVKTTSAFSDSPQVVSSPSSVSRFPSRQSIEPARGKFSTINEAPQPKSDPPAPKFKPRPIGFGDNHPVLKTLQKHLSSDRQRIPSSNRSVGSSSSFEPQGSFSSNPRRQNFGRSLEDKGSQEKASFEQSTKSKSSKPFITIKKISE